MVGVLPFLLASVLFVASCADSGPSNGELVRTESPLITARALAARVRRGEPIRLIDTRPPDAYAQGHVPRAVSLPVDALEPPQLDEPEVAPRQELARQIRRSGIRADQTVAVIDEGSREGLARAATLCWLLALADCERCIVLEGGMEAWTREIGEVSTRATAPPNNGALGRAPVRPAEFANFATARLATFDPSLALIDVRPLSAQGEIPGSVRLPLDEIVRNDGHVDGGLLHEVASRAGIFAESAPIVIGEDVREGALGWFLLARVASVSNVALFPGGLARWRQETYLPGSASLSPTARGAGAAEPVIADAPSTDRR